MAANYLPPDYKIRYVLFLDVLGFGEIVRTIESGDVVGKELLQTILNVSYGLQNDVYQTNATSEMQADKPHCTMFSDSLVISTTNNIVGLKSILGRVMNLQTSLMRKGVFTRGAIAKGLLWHDTAHLLGSGLNIAYELESKSAIYPRIVVSEEVYSDIAATQDELDKKFLNDLCLRDADGLYFVTPFHPYATSDEGISSEASAQAHLKEVSARIKHAANENIGKREIYSKYFWLARQLNEVQVSWQKKGLLPEVLEITLD